MGAVSWLLFVSFVVVCCFSVFFLGFAGFFCFLLMTVLLCSSHSRHRLLSFFSFSPRSRYGLVSFSSWSRLVLAMASSRSRCRLLSFSLWPPLVIVVASSRSRSRFVLVMASSRSRCRLLSFSLWPPLLAIAFCILSLQSLSHRESCCLCAHTQVAYSCRFYARVENPLGLSELELRALVHICVNVCMILILVARAWRARLCVYVWLCVRACVRVCVRACNYVVCACSMWLYVCVFECPLTYTLNDRVCLHEMLFILYFYSLIK